MRQLTDREVEVRDLALLLVKEGEPARDAAERALTVLPRRDLDPTFVTFLSGGTLRLVGGKVAQVG
jgi:hypothetical protein